jgi:hypothetical protein
MSFRKMAASVVASSFATFATRRMSRASNVVAIVCLIGVSV